MSNFYYCNDCKMPTTIWFHKVFHAIDGSGPIDMKDVCDLCNGTNWHAEIDKGTHYEQVKE